MRIVCFGLMVLLSACATRVPTEPIANEYKEELKFLYLAEKSVSGDFFRTRDFHTGALNETTQRSAAPYPALDSLFRLMRVHADSVIRQRMIVDGLRLKADSMMNGFTKIRTDRPLYKELKSMHFQTEQCVEIAAAQESEFQRLHRAYHDLKKQAGLRSITQLEYAELVNQRVIAWQDSLEEVGRLLASDKVDLRNRFPEQKGNDFFAHYKFISELEAMLKGMDATLMQLQNSLSRIEGGNQEEFYYFGPYIPERREYQATEGIIGQLAIIMQDCRSKHQAYRYSYN